jgi:hypothetical protein
MLGFGAFDCSSHLQRLRKTKRKSVREDRTGRDVEHHIFTKLLIVGLSNIKQTLNLSDCT